ncbi:MULTISPECIES: sulfur carrier protein ThiS [unclassified Yoonia]|uniref:sulfur carrier protein ThiS n=1 Tax=unclassified Yoonia TaxID=2629118 RepID=UPI002AFE031F|nr:MULTISPECIES: sulfur carrier protein ThiS [unclassified Yoonia]
MRIEVNGEAREITGTTVAAALDDLGWHDARVATALNGQFVPKAARDATPLSAGDRLEVLAPMQGG